MHNTKEGKREAAEPKELAECSQALSPVRLGDTTARGLTA
jgi:hypothetical protein